MEFRLFVNLFKLHEMFFLLKQQIVIIMFVILVRKNQYEQ